MAPMGGARRPNIKVRARTKSLIAALMPELNWS
jgi:hypothetical protein